MKYKVRQKVVYIGPDFRNHPIVLATRMNVPVPRGIYTIRGGRILPSGEPGYVFEEFYNRVARCMFSGQLSETHTNEQLLRPLQERKNDGEAFVAGLRPLLTQVWRIKVPDER